MSEKKPKTERSGKGVRRRKKPTGVSTGLAATELGDLSAPSEVTQLIGLIETDGGKVLCAYRDPYGGHWLLMASLPIEKVEATPYQRNLSETHVRKLETVIGKIGRFLDPIIAVRAQQNQPATYWTPNGFHRLSAMKTLGAKSIIAIVVPESTTAYQILALNTEKAHNLREKALEVIRMYRELARLDNIAEHAYALEFEEPAFITLGLCYEERPRFSGGAYHPILKRVDQFLKQPLVESMILREKRSKRVLELDDIVNQHVEALRKRGLTSPYLKSFIVARINPLRFRPKEEPVPSFDDTLDKMARTAAKFNPDRIKTEDVAKSGGAPDIEA